jgi:hypothetical protein
MVITLFEVLLFIGGLILGVALGVLAKRSAGLVILILILIGLLVYFGYLNTVSFSPTGVLQALGQLFYALLQFIISGLSVISGNITNESMFSFGTILGFVTGLAFPRTVRPVRTLGAGTRRFVREVQEERRHYVREAED